MSNIQPKPTRHEKQQKSFSHERKNKINRNKLKIDVDDKISRLRTFKVIIAMLHIFRNKDMEDTLDNELDTTEKINEL